VGLTLPPPAVDVAGRWLLDRREGGTSVYRRYESFAGRPSRAPRPGLELRADGTFAWLGGGPADGHVHGLGGRWEPAGPSAIELRPDDGGPPVRVTVPDGDPAELHIRAR
jgi:hypothetical protein